MFVRHSSAWVAAYVPSSDYIANALLTTRGDLIRRGAAAPERVALGSTDQVLKSDGTDAVWGTVATAGIANDAVTYAKLQNISAQFRVLARKSASAGDAEETTLSELLDFIGSAARGDILYRGSSAWARLAAGTTGNLLQTGGAAGDPSWAAYPTIVSLEALSFVNGDLVYATAADTLARRAIGSTNDYLQVVGGVPTWRARPTLESLEGLTIANGTLLYGTAADTLAALGIGATATYLQVSGGIPAWVARPTLESLEGLSLVSGDIIYATAADTLARLAKGTDGQSLQLASGLPAWQWAEETHGFALSDEATAITTGTAKLTVRPWAYAFTVTAVRASLATASSSGLPTVDINEGGTTILSTKLTIDANERTSTTAATAAVISDASIAADAEITFDIDVAGTGAKGLKVYITGRRT